MRVKRLRFNFSEGKQVKPAPSCTFSATENQILTKQDNKIGLSSVYLQGLLPDQRVSPASYTPGLPLSCLHSLNTSPSTALLRKSSSSSASFTGFDKCQILRAMSLIRKVHITHQLWVSPHSRCFWTSHQVMNTTLAKEQISAVTQDSLQKWIQEWNHDSPQTGTHLPVGNTFQVYKLLNSAIISNPSNFRYAYGYLKYKGIQLSHGLFQSSPIL